MRCALEKGTAGRKEPQAANEQVLMNFMASKSKPKTRLQRATRDGGWYKTQNPAMHGFSRPKVIPFPSFRNESRNPVRLI